MLLSLLADILAIDSLIRLWSQPIPPLWWQILAMVLGDFILKACFRISIRRHGRKSSSSRNLGLLLLANRLGLIAISLSTMLP